MAVIFSYKPILSDLPKHLNVKDKAVEFCSKPYGNISLAGDLNAKISDTRLDAFWNSWYLKSLGKKLTCFENSSNSFCTDLFLTILTKTIRSSQETQFFETGLSDFYKLVVIVDK